MNDNEEPSMNDSTQKVLEFLLLQSATVEEVARQLERTPRTVYRALKEIESLEGYTVVRTGEQTSYRYSVLAQETLHA